MTLKQEIFFKVGTIILALELLEAAFFWCGICFFTSAEMLTMQVRIGGFFLKEDCELV